MIQTIKTNCTTVKELINTLKSSESINIAYEVATHTTEYQGTMKITKTGIEVQETEERRIKQHATQEEYKRDAQEYKEAIEDVNYFKNLHPIEITEFCTQNPTYTLQLMPIDVKIEEL